MYVQVSKQGEVLECQPLPEAFDATGAMVDLQTCGRVHLSSAQPSWCGDLKVEIVTTASAIGESCRTPASPSNLSQLPVSGCNVASGEISPEAPTTLPHLEGFQIHALIGQGGMGTVWKAVQLSTGRSVALKLMRGGTFGSARARARFDREIELLARLDHPHIARLYQSGVHQGLYFYAMELVDGVPLDQFVRKGELPLWQMLARMEEICRAVDHAHRRGVIHRDLKPNNILVTPNGEPKVVDFGLAKAAADESADVAACVSVEGTVAGTLAYMSPEQAAGDLARLDTRTDVYSLGVMLYQFATGRMPHEPGDSPYELQRRIIHCDPPSPRQANRRIDRELESLILKAISRNPDERYATAAELADDLRRYRSGDPLRARPLTLGYVLRKRLIQHKTRVAVVVLVLLMAVSAAGYAYLRIAQERNRAEAHAHQTEQTLYQHRLLLANTEIQQGNIAHAIELLDACPEPLRHWEWRYLRRQADSSSHTSQLKAGRLHDLAVDSEGGVVRTLTRDGHLESRRLADGESVQSARLWTEDANVAAFNQDGTALAVYRSDQLELFDARTGTQVQAIPWNESPPVCLAGDRGGLRWAVADHDNRLTLLDASSGAAIWSMTLPSRATTIRFNAEGELAIAAINHVAWITPELSAPPNVSWWSGDQRVNALAFSPDNQTLAATDGAGTVRVWTRQRDRPVSVFTVSPNHPATTLAFNTDGDQLITAAANGDLRIWDWRNAQLLGTRHGHAQVVQKLSLCPTRQMLVSGDMWQTIKLWRVDDAGARARRIVAFDSPVPVNVLQLGQRNGGMLVAVAGGQTQIWWLKDGRRELLATMPQAAAAAFDQGGTRVALATSTEVSIWQLDGQEQTAILQRTIPARNVGSLRFFSDNQLLSGVTLTGLHIWDIQTGDETTHLEGNSLMSFDEANARLFARDQNNHSGLVAWDLTSLRRVSEYISPIFLHTITVSSDGAQIAAASADGDIYIWDPGKREPVRQWTADGGSPIHAISFTRDGRRLLTAGASVKIWEPQTGDELLTLDAGLRGGFFNVGFDESEETITANTSNQLVQWSIH